MQSCSNPADPLPRRIRAGPLSPGSYEHRDGVTWRDRPVVLWLPLGQIEVRAGQTLDLGAVRLEAPQQLELRVEEGRGQPVVANVLLEVAGAVPDSHSFPEVAHAPGNRRTITSHYLADTGARPARAAAPARAP